MTTNVAILPNGRQQFFDGNGHPLVGGTVTTYIPGGFTPKTTYSDSAGTIPNTNPITLDALGSAAIWGPGYYRQIVNDASGNLIWDVVTLAPQLGGAGEDVLFFETVASAISTTVTIGAAYLDVAGYYSAGDGGGATYIPTGGTGPGVIRTADGQYWKISSEELNPKMFGAHGDGVSDDTTAIQTFVTFITAGALKGSFFPTANYLISSTITIESHTQYWILDGLNSHIVQATDNTPCFTWNFTNGTDAINNSQFSNFLFDWSNNQTSADTLSLGLAFKTTVDNAAGIYNNTFENLTVGNGYGLFGTTNGTLILTVWGNRFQGLNTTRQTVGYLGDLSFTNSGGFPRNRFSGVYVLADSMTATSVLTFNQSNCLQLDDYEINDLNNLQALSMTQVYNSEIGVIRIESGTFSQNFEPIISIPNGFGVSIAGIELYNITFSPAAFCYIVGSSGTGVTGSIDVGQITVNSCIVSTGSVALVQSPVGQMLCRDFEMSNNTGTIIPVFSSDDSIFNVRFGFMSEFIPGPDQGDSSLSVYVKDATHGTTPNLIRYDTPITADRTIELTTIPRVVAGMKYKIIRTANATGSSNLFVHQSTGNIKALAPGQWMEITGANTNIFYETGFGQL